FKKAVKKAAELVEFLAVKHNIPKSNILQHKDVSSYGKDCPHYLRDGSKGVDWDDFMGLVYGKKEDKPNPKPSEPKPYTQDAKWPKLENYGPNVKKVQELLGKAGYDIKVDSSFGPATDKAVRDFQRKHNLAVDGQAGPATQNKLKQLINKKKQKRKLVVDGWWGPATTKALQRYFNTKVDGVISGQIQSTSIDNIPSAKVGTTGSNLIRAMQKWLGVKVDGNLGPATIKALQRRMGTH